ncbi:hypothetical protein F4779DRAFT_582652 [Xylariaceae sp. FL0662B]|nr:hypothetical protein F4779DRAFT_582652 [Xylariaceae sp. FL0662B]
MTSRRIAFICFCLQLPSFTSSRTAPSGCRCHLVRVVVTMDFVDPYSPELGLANKYEFVTEIAPGVWKVYRKNDKMEYLAHDVTDMMTRADPSEPVKGARTELNTLLDDWAGPGLLHPLMTILNHEHLVSMIDMFGVQRTSAGENGYTRMYAIWEYCDAGNLGNLLVRAPSGAIKKSTEDDDDEDKRMVDVDAVEQNMFLPESFCWHVLLSVLKALAWLHDGAQYIAYNEEREDWEMLPHDPNWRTILHRNITPTNIFLGHPRRNEWYGKCKLGNYGSAAVSAHFHGDLENNVKAEAGKALAPPQGVQYQPLDELIRLDKKFGNMYPAHVSEE